MALPATEDFTGANNTPVSSLANWSNVASDGYEIFQNKARPDSSIAECADRWDADSFNDDQYAEATIVSLGTAYIYCGVAVRCSASVATYYTWYGDDTDGSYLYKAVAGVYTQLGSLGAPFSATDVVRLEAEGTTITPKIGGVTESPPGAQTDSAISSGYAGIGGYDQGTIYIDDWEGGNLGAPPPGQPAILRTFGIPTGAGARNRPGGWN